MDDGSDVEIIEANSEASATSEFIDIPINKKRLIILLKKLSNVI